MRRSPSPPSSRRSLPLPSSTTFPRVRSRVRALTALLVGTVVASFLVAAPRHCMGSAGAGDPPRIVHIVDDSTQIDVNHVAMFVTNTGSFAGNRTAPGQPPGFEFPKGSQKYAVYAAGLWLGAQVNGQVRVAVSEYSEEYAPGSVIGSGVIAVPDDPNRAEYKVYKLRRDYGGDDPTADLLDYDTGAVPHGAPVVTRNLDGTLNIQGDQMLWAVFNDLSPGHHYNPAGSTAPLGVEVRQTTYAFDDPGPLGNTVFIRYELINKSNNRLESMYVGVWADPDIGNPADDLEGSDPVRGLGYAYNATNSDSVYGSNPPSVGIDLLRGPKVGASRLPATAFVRYINGTDPRSVDTTYNYLRGLNADGSPVIDPTTSLPTTFMLSGDPVSGTGWLDVTPADRRMLLASGPFTMEPGDSQEVVVAILAGQGNDRLSSITAMRSADDAAQALFDVPTPALLSEFHASIVPGGLELRWRVYDARAFANAELQRAEHAGGPWTTVISRRDEGGDGMAVDGDVQPGRIYHYRVVVTGPKGELLILGEIVAIAGSSVNAFEITWVRPNPSPRSVTVEYTLPRAARVRLSVLDLQGREVAIIRDGDAAAGRHQATWDGRVDRVAAAPGVYFVRCQAQGASALRRIVIAR